MPIYDYVCPHCNEKSEYFIKSSDRKDIMTLQCKSCDVEGEMIYSPTFSGICADTALGFERNGVRKCSDDFREKLRNIKNNYNKDMQCSINL
jgi:predicted nucleic acid-binding Zn ribbon protein